MLVVLLGPSLCALTRLPLARLAPRTLAVIAFDDDVKVLLPATKMNERGKARAVALINRLQADGGTALWDGLEAGLKAALPADATVAILTDGQVRAPLPSHPLLLSVVRHAPLPLPLSRDSHFRPPSPISPPPSLPRTGSAFDVPCLWRGCCPEEVSRQEQQQVMFVRSLRDSFDGHSSAAT